MNHEKLKYDITAWRIKQKPSLSLNEMSKLMGYTDAALPCRVINGRVGASYRFWVSLEEVTGGELKKENYVTPVIPEHEKNIYAGLKASHDDDLSASRVVVEQPKQESDIYDELGFKHDQDLSVDSGRTESS